MQELNVPTWMKAIPVALSTGVGLLGAVTQNTLLVITGIPGGFVVGFAILFFISKRNSA